MFPLPSSISSTFSVDFVPSGLVITVVVTVTFFPFFIVVDLETDLPKFPEP